MKGAVAKFSLQQPLFVFPFILPAILPSIFYHLNITFSVKSPVSNSSIYALPNSAFPLYELLSIIWAENLSSRID